MLNSLELVGFKSFADKTRFEFGPGLSAIVGPNGSGKSNVVDALCWVLGEQSPKSLRSKEMADVIFNGSKHRRSMGMAEVSLALGNHSRFLPIESDQLTITRRVYRSGEGEYLINGQLARLRDIRDMLLGSGSGGTYNIIAQGRIEMLLQASTKDRRFIIEEAAGISKFRARKLDTLRRLERVDQNLLRARDIHEEIDKQIRSLRIQAGKARSFQEASERLRELRVSVGLADLFRRRRDLAELDQAMAALAEQRASTDRALAEAENRLAEMDATLTDQEERRRSFLAQTGELDVRISTALAELQADETRHGDIEEQTAKSYEQLALVSKGLADLARQHAGLAEQVQLERARQAAVAQRIDQHQLQLVASNKDLEESRQQLASCRAEASGALNRLGRLENEQSGLESQLTLLWQQRERLEKQWLRLAGTLRRLARALIQFDHQAQGVRRQIGWLRSRAGDIEEEHRALLANRRELSGELAAARDRRTALASRLDVLEALQQRHDGLASGVRHAISLTAAGAPPWHVVRGVLAESLVVPADHADLVELALGNLAESLVLRSWADLGPELIEAARQLPGRITFLACAPPDDERWTVVPDDVPGPPLARVVECELELRRLVHQLLGATFLADDLSMARRIAQAAPGVRVVTRAGEVLEPDGAVRAGPVRGTIGILSRTAEIHQLRDEVRQIDQRIVQKEAALRVLDDRIHRLEARLSHHALLHSTLTEQCRHFEIVLERMGQQRRSLDQQYAATVEDILRLDREMAQARQQSGAVEQALAHTHTHLKALHERTNELGGAMAECEGTRNRLDKELGQARLELAVIEQRLGTIESRQASVQAERELRQAERMEGRERLRQLHERTFELHRRWLRALAEWSELVARRESLHRNGQVDPRDLDHLRSERARWALAAKEHRSTLDELRSQSHAAELRRTELRLNRDALLARTQDDYGIDLAGSLPADYSPPDESQCEETRREIGVLRDKIARLGGVNVQAVQMLSELEGRAATLAYQIDDLASAKQQLEEVIRRINTEGRRLFLETFETVRGHFQDLFRKLFGGGHADMLLEDETDVLETGIEIIARPPGKEPRNISLLSGGEKTLTAVALIMGLFRSKPTPFCVLDEVDAALDEANIGRFIDVVREFRDRSQFLLITHSKTTMAAADVLHGVTQRESGVSLRVSVRLDQVAEDGTIAEPVAQSLGDSNRAGVAEVGGDA